MTLVPPPVETAELPDYPAPETLTAADVARGRKARRHILLAALVLIGVNLLVAAAYFFTREPVGPVAGVEVMAWKLEPGEYRTYYLTGMVTNTTAKRIPEARVEFETVDSTGIPSGITSVLVSNLAPASAVSFVAQTTATQSVWEAKVKGVFHPRR